MKTKVFIALILLLTASAVFADESSLEFLESQIDHLIPSAGSADNCIQVMRAMRYGGGSQSLFLRVSYFTRGRPGRQDIPLPDVDSDDGPDTQDVQSEIESVEESSQYRERFCSYQQNPFRSALPSGPTTNPFTQDGRAAH